MCLLGLLAGCAGYSGYGLRPGEATVEQVVAVMGQPALRWQDADGSIQFAYPRGPQGVHTYMAHFGADGRLRLLENVLDMKHFARIVPGQDRVETILRLLGPPNPAWSVYFKARDELVWEWRFCDDWSRLARFDVLFDATSGVVRTSYQRPDLQGPNSVAPFCSH